MEKNPHKYWNENRYIVGFPTIQNDAHTQKVEHISRLRT